jgi:fido (protein-threonine AMPylation protein)
MLNQASSCPPWADDAAEHDLAELDRAVTKVCADACAEAKRHRPGRKELRRWHLRSFRNVVPMDYYAGHFRQRDPQRPCLAADGGVKHPDGTLLPATPNNIVLATMEAFERDLHSELVKTEGVWRSLTAEQRVLNTAAIVGMAVAKFIQIHPFINGNGRMSRMLWTVLTWRLGFPASASVVKRPGPPYGDVMDQAMRGNAGPAVALVLVALGKMAPPPDDLQIEDVRAAGA